MRGGVTWGGGGRTGEEMRENGGLHGWWGKKGKKKEREKNVVCGWWGKKKKNRGTGTKGEREEKIEKIRYLGSCEKK
jgi:hypothetical protein